MFISPRGTTYSNFVDPAKSHMNTATRTVVVSGSKDQFVNMEVNEQLDLIPRCEVRLFIVYYLIPRCEVSLFIVYYF